MPSSPAFQWYPKDCDTDENVRLMDDREFGFYMRCLNHSWLNFGLPLESGERARVLGRTQNYVEKRWERVGRCFVIQDGRYVNLRQESQRTQQLQRSRAMAEAASKRWSGNAGQQCSSNARALPKQCSPSPSPSASVASPVVHSPVLGIERTYPESSAKTADGEFALSPSGEQATFTKLEIQDEWFDREFWPAIWVKSDKGAARKSFRKVATSRAMKDRIIAAVVKQGPKILARASATGGTPIFPSTWLNRGRYDDEETVVPQPPRPAVTDEDPLPSGYDLMIQEQEELRQQAERRAASGTENGK